MGKSGKNRGKYRKDRKMKEKDKMRWGVIGLHLCETQTFSGVICFFRLPLESQGNQVQKPKLISH